MKELLCSLFNVRPCIAFWMHTCNPILLENVLSSTGGLALIEPSRLGDIISLVGAVASTALALTFPPLIHILVFYCGDKWHLNGCGRLQQHERDADEVNSTTGEDPPLLKKKSSSYSKGDCAISSICIVKNLAITTLGAVGGVLGTYAAISDLVESIVNPSGTCN